MATHQLIIPILSSYFILLVLVFRQTVSPIILAISLLLLTFLSTTAIVCLHLSQFLIHNIYFWHHSDSLQLTNHPNVDPERLASNSLKQPDPWNPPVQNRQDWGPQTWAEVTPWTPSPQDSPNPPPTPKPDTPTTEHLEEDATIALEPPTPPPSEDSSDFTIIS